MGKYGHLTTQEIHEILDMVGIQHVPDYFVETGTYMGHSTLEASRVFSQVYTIELNEQLIDIAKQRCKDVNNIIFLRGDSLQLLPTTFVPNASYCWFLDAHQSGSDTCNNGIGVPLLQEIELILKFIYNHKPKQSQSHLFIIDDVRLFSQNDWLGVSIPTMRKLFEQYNISIIDEYIYNDRYIVHSKA